MSSAPKAVQPAVNGWNADYLEAQFASWQRDPASVAPDMRQFFQGFELGLRGLPGSGAPPLPTADAQWVGGSRAAEDRAQAAVSSLIQHYREIGHLCAAIDPFGRERPCPEELTPQYHGLREEDLDRTFNADTVSTDGSPMALRDIIAVLDETYCRTIGVEFAHISSEEERLWLEHRMETTRNRLDAPRELQFHILYTLYRAELFERFCGKRYLGVKRFSLEGGESLIPMLDRIVESAGTDFHVEEIVLGMSHRGRLNVLTNVVGKTYEQIFTEFEDAWTHEDALLGGGDVKYHRGFSSNRLLKSGRHIWLAMASNPSHLEAAGAVVLGRCRAKQRMRGDTTRSKVIPINIHGDAAIAGQGVVAENFNLSQLDGYTVGGTIHIVINNLIGFTTGEEDARSTRYCTDVAKMIEAPIFHVNGEDPAAVVHVAQIALDYRMKFGKDVVIDLLCYRKHGHNETDEASLTQPLLYELIRSRKSVLETYAEQLRRSGVISDEDLKRLHADLEEDLDRAYRAVKKTPVDPTPDPGARRWEGFSNTYTFDTAETKVGIDVLAEIAQAMGRRPEGFESHRKLARTLEQRGRIVEDRLPVDWAAGESFAVGSLLLEGTIVRFSGQDSRRGTFSHRHAVIRDMKSNEAYCPLNHIRELGLPGTDRDVGTLDDLGRPRQAKYCIYDSPLSEYAVLGFEYGFSLASPNTLVIWEAQFGDFANGAQVIIDQFIASAEAKWHRWSGLVLLLPHGYEGQGPEHSSARVERFLKLCGDNNIQVCNPTTPAQYFHMLRRQVRTDFRKPLIVMTPKSLLRLPAATSTIDELSTGRFQCILDDPAFRGKPTDRVNRVLLCSGKVYYDLDKRRQEIERDDTAIVRVEQLYPFHHEQFEVIRHRYPEDAQYTWVQEEPKNMGAYGHMVLTYLDYHHAVLPYIGRPVSSTPATGSPSLHARQLEAFLTEAIGAKEPAKAEVA